MKQVIKIIASISVFLIFSVNPIYSGTTGKISGTITDKVTGQPLIGVNLIVQGTNLGAATDLEGRFTILEVPPGTYDVQVTYIGYRKVIVNDVRVFIDQTAKLDLALEPETLQLNELVVVAERKNIKRDVSTSVTSISTEEINILPVSNIEGVVGLQAGIQGLNIRGGGTDRLLFMIDGVTMRDPRNNEPTTKVALSSVKELNIERGGFNAEYGQVQSGVVNVVSNEGNKKYYAGRLQFKISPPATKYWLAPGTYDISNPMSYALRSFFDDAVCWTGTGNGEWDEYTRNQYPEFMGWNAVSEILNTDNNPNNDLTPAGAQRVFEYEIRKKQANNQPDYDIDAGFGGPIPLISEMLGDLRFFTSYRSTRDMLIYPLTRSDYKDYDATLQLISDISPSMKLRLSGLYGQVFTMRGNWDGTGYYSYLHYPYEIAGAASYIGGTSDLVTLFSDFNFALSDISHQSLAGKFTHTLSSTSFYEVSIENFKVDYFTRPSALRDTSQKAEVIPGYYEDSNPLGYWPFEQLTGVIITGGQHVAKPRDNTQVSTTTVKADFTSQINFQNLLKAGIEFNYNDLDFDYGTIASATGGQSYASRVQMRVFPFRGSAYIQDKLETEEFILNAGLRLDYSNSNTYWWDFGPYDKYFISNKYEEDRPISTTSAEPQWQLSPRLGISHPITENAKLFFNYGHFKQIPNYESMFRVGRNNSNELVSIGDPNLQLAKTISYELGFDYSLSDDILLQLAAYYRDISDLQTYTNFVSVKGLQYSKSSSNNYQDTRGFEFTFRKNYGRWISGFANYTYQVTTSGHFGSAYQYQNISDQKKYNDATVNLYQDRPIPQPYARANINFYTPSDFGPEIAGHQILGGWMLNILMDWQSGYWSTWNPKGITAVGYNVQAVDYFNTNLRLSKTFNVGKLSFDFFMDVNNVFNTHRLWNRTDQFYLASLHLPKSDTYDNIPGEDKIGDYREPGVEYQPMVYQYVIDINQTGKERAIYYEGSSEKYFEFKNGEWSQVEQSRIDQILDDKAYIDMPNASTFWFLDPRKIFFGITISFNFSD